jgi:hypothetical protein
MILIITSIYDLAFQARVPNSWALRHSGLPGFPVVWINAAGDEFANAVLSVVTNNNLCTRSHTKEWMQARHSPKVFKLPYYSELGPAN